VCGVFGVIRPGGITDNDRQSFEELSLLLRHRGPDGDGFISTASALLGMHRLSIMDVEHGWQPFWSEDGQIGVLANGEIYNAASLRAGLVARSHIFRTNSDIEVVPHLYEERGIECINYLRGMFAIVILDKRSDEVILVRDRLGEKPLSFAKSDGAIYFASEQSPLVKAEIVDLRLDNDVLASYLLHGFVPEPRSIIEGVAKVPAAHAMRISLKTGDSTLVKYWDPMDFVGTERLTAGDLSVAVQDAIITATTSDVPVGVALSGGLDSSMIAAVASRVRPDLQAFTIAYDEPGFDESQMARDLAKQLGITCHTTTLNTTLIAEQFAETCGIRDEPISDIAGPALAALPRSAKDHGVPVLLTGVGGDELFWGYEWMRKLAAWTTKYTLGQNEGWPLRFSAPPSTLQGRASWLLSGGGLRENRGLISFMKRWSSAERVPLPLYEFQYGYREVTRAIRSMLNVEEPYPFPEFFGSLDPELKGAEYTAASLDSYLRVNSLTQIDRLSMRQSVESRTPFADSRLIETVMSERVDTLQVFEPTKLRQRAVAELLLPPSVVNRPKRGFTPPVRKWLHAIWAANTFALSASETIARSYAEPVAVQKQLRRPVKRDGRVNQIGLRLMTLELWLQSFR